MYINKMKNSVVQDFVKFHFNSYFKFTCTCTCSYSLVKFTCTCTCSYSLVNLHVHVQVLMHFSFTV